VGSEGQGQEPEASQHRPWPWKQRPCQRPAAECPRSAFSAGKLQAPLAPLAWQGQAGLNLFLKIRPVSSAHLLFTLTPPLSLRASHTSRHSLSPPRSRFSLLAFRGEGRWQHLLSQLITRYQSPSKNQNDSDSSKRKAQRAVPRLAARVSPEPGDTGGPPLPGREHRWPLPRQHPAPPARSFEASRRSRPPFATAPAVSEVTAVCHRATPGACPSAGSTTHHPAGSPAGPRTSVVVSPSVTYFLSIG